MLCPILNQPTLLCQSIHVPSLTCWTTGVTPIFFVVPTHSLSASVSYISKMFVGFFGQSFHLSFQSDKMLNTQRNVSNFVVTLFSIWLASDFLLEMTRGRGGGGGIGYAFCLNAITRRRFVCFTQTITNFLNVFIILVTTKYYAEWLQNNSNHSG